MTKCAAQTANWEPCQAQAISGSTFCFTHDPTQGAARAQAHKRGGERRRAIHGADPSAIPTKVRSLTEIMAILDFALAEVLVMENSIQRARVLISLSDAYLKGFEMGELQARLEQLEQEVLKK